MMARTEILNRLRDVMTTKLELPPTGRLNEQDRLFEELNIDSIMVLQFMVYIEEEFAVVIPEEEMDPAVFKTVGSLISFIQQLQERNREEQIASFLRQKIAELIEYTLSEEQLNDSDPIKDMGMDSVKTINLIIQIEQQFDIAFEDEEMVSDNFFSIRKIVATVLDKLGVQA